MQNFAEHADAIAAIWDYPIVGLPAAVADAYRGARTHMSAPKVESDIAELLYANRASLDDAGRELAAGLAAFCAQRGFYELQVDGRGDKIVMALRRDLGETPPAGTSWPAAADDPAPLKKFALAPAAAPVSPAPAGPAATA